jgi:hypothetical protein
VFNGAGIGAMLTIAVAGAVDTTFDIFRQFGWGKGN